MKLMKKNSMTKKRKMAMITELLVIEALKLNYVYALLPLLNHAACYAWTLDYNSTCTPAVLIREIEHNVKHNLQPEYYIIHKNK